MKEYSINIGNYPYRICEQGRGVPLVWLHGMFYSLAIEDVFSVFDFGILSKHLRLIRIELPAHGISPVPVDAARLTWPSVAHDIREILAQVTDGPYFAGGFSQGAGISAHLVKDNPNAAGLIMAMLPRVWEQRPLVQKVYKKLISQLVSRNDKKALEKLFGLVRYAPLHMGWEEEKAKQIRELMLALPVEAFRLILEGAVLSDMPPVDAIKNNGKPVFLTGWGDDPNHPYEQAEAIRNTLDKVSFYPMFSKKHQKSATFQLLAFIFANL